MSPNLIQLLIRRWPTVYRRGICYSHGDGWLGLLDALGERLALLVEQGAIEPLPISEIKEKYGGLRIRLESTNAVAGESVTMIELASERVCEICGAPGRQQGDEWVLTRCAAHAATSNTFAREHGITYAGALTDAVDH